MEQEAVLTETATGVAAAEQTQPAADERLLAGRARTMFDVFHPLLEELRPLMNDLRPVAEELRWLVVTARPLIAALVGHGRTAVARAEQKLDDPAVRSAGATVGATVGSVARRLSTFRPSVSTPTVSLPALQMPAAPTVRVPSIRVPSIGRPRIGLPVRAIARRLRPGRRAFRAVAVSIIVIALSEPTVRGTITEQLDSTASFVQTLQLPVVDLSKIELPAVELPAIELPAVEMPKFELPAIDLSKIEIPAFQLPGQPATAPAQLAPATFELPPLDAYRASFETQAAYPTVAPNGTVEWVVALRNTGSVGWYRGVAGAQASLALPDGTEAAVQTTPYVAPGQVGWFVVRFRAPAAPGTQTIQLYPRIDGRGELPDLGIFTLVTVR